MLGLTLEFTLGNARLQLVSSLVPASRSRIRGHAVGAGPAADPVAVQSRGAQLRPRSSLTSSVWPATV